jgi:hypothetical protein
MKNYKIYSEKKDFTIDENVRNLTGSRTKKMVFMNNDKSKAMIKYNKYLNCTELASEKIAYEIAKVLKFKCAKIELAIDKDGTLGILNYYFLKKGTVHSDALFYLRKMGNDRSEYHNLKNVLNFLEAQNKQVVNDFLKIMLFDSLIGEQDRHEENWGITKSLNEVSLSPIYDNGCSLLRDQSTNLDELLHYPEKMNKYIQKSTSLIYDNYGKKYKHFALIDELLNIYPDQMKKIIKNLKKLNDKKVEDIVNAMPKNYLSEKHKKCIIIFIKKRRDILLSKLGDE